MTDFRIWFVIWVLSALTMTLRMSFIVFLGDRELPDYVRRYLRYVAVAIIPGMVAGLVTFPASLGGVTNATWMVSTSVAFLIGLKWKNPLIIMLAGAACYIAMEILL